jgi:hypothetical protein
MDTIENNEKIVKLLQSKNLQKILLEINSAEEPHEKLEEILNNNEEFSKFIS